MTRQTHVVTNQPPPLTGHDVFSSDRALVEAVERYGGRAGTARLSALGMLAGSADTQRLGVEANSHPPTLRSHDRFGNRIDEVDFHPAWHALLTTAVGQGLQAAPWQAPPATSAHVVRAAGFIVWSQVEAGHGCPVSMTYAAVPAMRMDPAIADEWVPRLAASSYDFSLRPAAQKRGCLAGMGMTEKQGGSDVRANTTYAERLAADGEYQLSGHKWFCSAPMSDVFLMLAQAKGGLTCFVVVDHLVDQPQLHDRHGDDATGRHKLHDRYVGAGNVRRGLGSWTLVACPGHRLSPLTT